MILSTAHTDARAAAVRLPALAASLALLASSDATRASLTFYGGTPPADGAAPAGDALATAQLTARAGVVDSGAFAIVLDAPIEAQVTGADPAAGTATTWARILTPAGDWWADVSVGVAGSGADVIVSSALLLQGGFVRVTEFVVEG